MHGYGFGFAGWGIMLAGAILVLLVLIGLIFLVIWAVRQGKGPGRNESGHRLQSAEDILKARYARGEITREQYLSMLEDLNG